MLFHSSMPLYEWFPLPEMFYLSVDHQANPFISQNSVIGHLFCKAQPDPWNKISLPALFGISIFLHSYIITCFVLYYKQLFNDCVPTRFLSTLKTETVPCESVHSKRSINVCSKQSEQNCSRPTTISNKGIKPLITGQFLEIHTQLPYQKRSQMHFNLWTSMIYQSQLPVIPYFQQIWSAYCGQALCPASPPSHPQLIGRQTKEVSGSCHSVH